MAENSTSKTAIVTGAGSGIGRASARALLDNGYRVALLGRRKAPLEDSAGNSPDALVLPCDVTDPSAVDDAFGKVRSHFGRLDVLFNNAGISKPSQMIDEMPTEDWALFSEHPRHRDVRKHANAQHWQFAKNARGAVHQHLRHVAAALLEGVYYKVDGHVRAYQWETGGSGYHIVALDCGLKYNILRLLSRLGASVTAVPCTTPAEDILSLKPDGILLSPGPGDPDLLDNLVETVKGLVGRKPIMGICLGSQLLARAFGGRNFKLKFGHRGGNHPVRELATGRIHITAQNHGYAVDPETIGNELEVTHINLNDGTVEGRRHRELPIFAIQYHSEASPGPLDNVYLFEEFMAMVKEGKQSPRG